MEAIDYMTNDQVEELAKQFEAEGLPAKAEDCRELLAARAEQLSAAVRRSTAASLVRSIAALRSAK